MKQLYSNELYHVGVKGMRWGIRRGPKSESSGSKEHKVTADQLNKTKNVTDGSSKIAEEGGKITKAVGVIRATRKREDISQLTDAELKSKITRMNLEQQYSNLSSGQVSKGQAYAKSTFEIAGSALAIGSSAVGIAVAIKQLKGN